MSDLHRAMSTIPLRVIVVDDHALVRQGIRQLIDDQADMEVVGDVGDGPAALRLTQELLPSVVLTDVSMPGWSGVKVAEMIVHVCPGVKVIGVSRHYEHGFVRAMLDAGANGYVLKQSAGELPRAIRAVAAGGQYLDPALARRILPFKRPAGAYIGTDGPLLDSNDERILRLASASRSDQEIADKLLMAVGDIANRRTQAMQKIGVGSRIQLLEYALARGWQDPS